MHRITLTSAVALLASVLISSTAMAQPRTVVVAGPAAVLNEPRGDSQVVGQVKPGTTLEVVDTWDTWYLVSAPADGDVTGEWQHGWVRAEALQLPGGRRVPSARDGRFMIRAFGHAGGLLFTAKNSFDAILGNKIGTVYGTGGQMVLPNGIYAQASMDKLRKTGGRALISGSRVFTLEIPNRLSVTAVEATVGYRKESSNKVASYFGGGVGWHTLDEEEPSDVTTRISKKHIGYHVVGGAEYPIVRWISIGGEVQWATVPKALGETGVSAHFGEKDLGGTTFRLKMIVGY